MWTDFHKFFHQFIREKILYKDLHLTCSMFATPPCEFLNSKNVTEFSRWTRQLIRLTKIYCEIIRNLLQKYCTIDFT